MSWRTNALLLAGAAAIVAALPALGQDRQAPASLLPPGFADPQNLPPPEEKREPQQRPQQQQQQQAPPVAPGNSAGDQLSGNMMGDVEEVQLDQSALPRPTNYFTIPEGSERSIDRVGPLEPGNFGLCADAFGARNGALYAAMRPRLQSPLPSRSG